MEIDKSQKLIKILKAYYNRTIGLDDLPFNKANIKIKSELNNQLLIIEPEFPIDLSYLTKRNSTKALIVTN